MHTTKCEIGGYPGVLGKPAGPRFRKWAALILSFFLVWVFMFMIAPRFQGNPMIRPLADFISDRGIDASALYYTEVEEAAEAELNMRTTLEYTP